MTHEKYKEKFLDVGRILSRRREELGFDVENVSLKLKITESELKDIENGEICNYLDKFYYTGTLRKYCKILSIKYEKLQEYFSEDLEKINTEIANKFLAVRSVKKSKINEISFRLTCSIAMIIILIVCANTFIQKNIINMHNNISLDF